MAPGARPPTESGRFFQPAGQSRARRATAEVWLRHSQQTWNNTDSGGKRVKPAQKADIDIERANYEDALVRHLFPQVQYVVSEAAPRVPSHVSRSDLVSAG